MEDIEALRKGNGGIWKADPGYSPYYTAGDFNGDGRMDFAAAVFNPKEAARPFVILVFNGPFAREGQSPAFVSEPLELKHAGLFFGPPRPRPYRLVVGSFDSGGRLLQPDGISYRWR